MPFEINEKPGGLTFKIRVQPRSSRNKVVGVYGDRLKVMLTAPPVDNAANKACQSFLAKGLGVAKSSISIVSGHTGRDKQVLVQCSGNEAQRRAIRGKLMAWAGQ